MIGLSFLLFALCPYSEIASGGGTHVYSMPELKTPLVGGRSPHLGDFPLGPAPVNPLPPSHEQPAAVQQLRVRPGALLHGPRAA